jgi:hypothetical protein
VDVWIQKRNRLCRASAGYITTTNAAVHGRSTAEHGERTSLSLLITWVLEVAWIPSKTEVIYHVFYSFGWDIVLACSPFNAITLSSSFVFVYNNSYAFTQHDLLLCQPRHHGRPYISAYKTSQSRNCRGTRTALRQKE